MFGKHTIHYNSSKKVFWVKLDSGEKYEKKTVEELSKELSQLGVKWKLSGAAKRQVKAFKVK
jgi:hypothetical protein